MLGTKFGAVHVNPEANVSFRTREMESPDQARMNSEVLQDLNDLEFVVGADETLTCPFQNMVTLQHQEAPMLLGGASTPSMERLLRQKLSTSKNNVAKLKGLCRLRRPSQAPRELRRDQPPPRRRRRHFQGWKDPCPQQGHACRKRQRYPEAEGRRHRCHRA